MDESVVDVVLEDLAKEGVDPRQFLLRFFFRITVEKLDKFSQKERETFLVWITDSILGIETNQ